VARTRSARAHGQVLEAALQLFAERGVEATSMDAIAEASGVSKATIYKHWPDKDALCLEVMAHLHGLDELPPAIDSTDIRADIVALLQYHYQPRKQYLELRIRMMPHLMAYAARSPAFGKAWRARVFEPPRVRLAQLLERAIAKGELPRTLDIDFAIALLLGPMMYHQVLRLVRRELPEDMPQRVVESFWRAHAATAQSDQRSRRRALAHVTP
jgi:AcrR family transcriptional regulator